MEEIERRSNTAYAPDPATEFDVARVSLSSNSSSGAVPIERRVSVLPRTAFNEDTSTATAPNVDVDIVTIEHTPILSTGRLLTYPPHPSISHAPPAVAITDQPPHDLRSQPSPTSTYVRVVPRLSNEYTFKTLMKELLTEEGYAKMLEEDDSYEFVDGPYK